MGNSDELTYCIRLLGVCIFFFLKISGYLRDYMLLFFFPGFIHLADGGRQVLGSDDGRVWKPEREHILRSWVFGVSFSSW